MVGTPVKWCERRLARMTIVRMNIYDIVPTLWLYLQQYGGEAQCLMHARRCAHNPRKNQYDREVILPTAHVTSLSLTRTAVGRIGRPLISRGFHCVRLIAHELRPSNVSLNLTDTPRRKTDHMPRSLHLQEKPRNTPYGWKVCCHEGIPIGIGLHCFHYASL